MPGWGGAVICEDAMSSAPTIDSSKIRGIFCIVCFVQEASGNSVPVLPALGTHFADVDLQKA